ncbi:nitroreductase family protein [Puia sp. P3]|uniref:nitroreductase family protein n=1 Tax=Puia sp. P3 TaxID=3423952 RepID=UPI003D66C0F8
MHLSHGIDLHAIQDPVFHGAPVVIFITAPRDNEWAPLDIGMCAQNIMLSAQSLGLSSCPVGFGKYVENTPAYDRMLIPPRSRYSFRSSSAIQMKLPNRIQDARITYHSSTNDIIWKEIFDNKVALVTGGSFGIGQATAIAFAKGVHGSSSLTVLRIKSKPLFIRSKQQGQKGSSFSVMSPNPAI